MKQHEAVIEAMRAQGGYATLGQLNHAALRVKGSVWGTKTPFASIRRIVQDRPEFFKIKPGLWGLEEARAQIERRFAIGAKAAPEQKQQADHSYYQGLIVEIGNLRGFDTIVPAQDKNRLYLSRPLAASCTLTAYPAFTYPAVLARARMIDVAWFNARHMPGELFEVEHSTDIYGALLRFMELQDFTAQFHIVADDARRKEYESKIASSTFDAIRPRTNFLDYEKLADYHTKSMATAEAARALHLFD